MNTGMPPGNGNLTDQNQNRFMMIVNVSYIKSILTKSMEEI